MPPPIPPSADASSRAAPRTKAEREGQLALAAMQRGQAALAEGDVAAAIEWLERALRYAPDDPAPLLSLAAARLAGGDAAAALAGFRTVAVRCNVREAWLGVAVACLRLRDAAEAARALHNGLSRHRWDGARAVADSVASAAHLPGWCALAPDGTIALGLRGAGRPSIRVDGQPVAAERPIAESATRIEVTLGAAHLLGSPIEARLIHRVEGLVAVRDGGLEGWAWHPGDPERDPLLRLTDGTHELRIAADDQAISAARPLTRPRGFALDRKALADFTGPIRVTGSDGEMLSGSPVDPGMASRSAAAVAGLVAARWPCRGQAIDGAPVLLPVAAEVTGTPASAPLDPLRPVVIVVPVYRGLRETLACLDAVRLTVPRETGIIVVDDATPEPELAAALDALQADGTIRLLRRARNGGFPAAANDGLRAACALPGARDVLLLNNDTLPAAGWLDALRRAVQGAADIGSASPLSNDATILSYPDPGGEPGEAPRGAELARLARQAARANAGSVVDIPTAVGFCMYLRRECLEQTGVFRDDLFAQGYGEENDFCLRARHLGWRHVAVPGAYVAHLGGRSFGGAREALIARNLHVLEQVHPGYRALIEAWIARDPLFAARRRLDAERWRASCRVRHESAVLLVTHDSGGGVERCVQARAAEHRAAGRRPLLLRPVLDRSGQAQALERAYLPGLCRIEETARDWPNLRFRVPDELGELAALLRAARPVAMEVHHLLGHDHALLELARLLRIPYEMRVHDYAAFCPRITLLDVQGRYCGEPDEATCVACIADQGSRLEEAVTVGALRERSAAEFGGASRVVVPSQDAALRLRRHFPAVWPVVEPHEDDAAHPLPVPVARVRRVCVVGAIGREKGFDVLLACARDAAARALDLRYRVVGHTIDDARLLDTGRADITGPFAAEEAEALIRAQAADIAFLPSIWPETWCLALGDAWRAGLAVAAFDIGAPAERIRRTGRGWLLPLGLPPARINNALLTLPPLAAVGRVMQTR